MENILSIYGLSDKLRQLMKEEIIGTFNRWVTKLDVGHDPTDEECAQHYLTHGGVDNFRKKYNVLLSC